MDTIKNLSSRALLIILDGFGIRANDHKNAIGQANTKTLDALFSLYPFCTIEAGGEKVGLPKGVIGNSEVGHMNLGAGRPVRQDLVRINESIRDQSFSTLPRLVELKSVAKKNTGRIHLLGLLSDGGVHSHIDHLKQIIDSLKGPDINLFLHAFMDGRDTAQNVGEKYLLEMTALSDFTFASMQGRSIGMDRDRRWDKIQLSYQTMIGKGLVRKISPLDYLHSEYQAGRLDEFLTPCLFDSGAAIAPGDCIFFFNFRSDRAAQLATAFNVDSFEEFKREFIPPYFLCMTPYIQDELPLPVLFDKERITGGLSEHLSSIQKRQFKIAETEKYAHVTYFFNGGQKAPFPGEEHFLIPSPQDVATYDQRPEMSAEAVTNKLLTALDEDYDFYLVNFANSDMVGHTGNFRAAVSAIEFLDQCIARLVSHCAVKGISIILTADHGNSDQMAYDDGSPHTSHTDSPVPFCVIHPRLEGKNCQLNGKQHALMDVSPTVLYTMGIEIPENFTGATIFK